MTDSEQPSDRSSPALPLGPALLAADVGIGWLLYVHVHPATGLVLLAVAALLACSLLADTSRSVIAAIRRSIRMDG